MFLFGVFFTQSDTNERMAAKVQGDDLSPDLEELQKYFGNLALTILSLCQAMSGGVDWGNLAGPLMVEISPWMGVVFTGYIVIALLALMNVVTGVFLQTALQSSRAEEDMFLTDQIVTSFKKKDQDLKDSKVSILDVEDVIQNPTYSKEWKAINVEPDEAKWLFRLLDIHDSGWVELEEFLSGCLRLRGEAKA